MKIVKGTPPNFDEIIKVFPMAASRGVIFTWGDTIYNPDGCVIQPPLLAHENAHYQRQTNDTPAIEAWWKQYLVDAEFRHAEELIAHRVEYKAFCNHHADRNHRSAMLDHIARKMSSGLYGNLISLKDARGALR